MRRGSANVHGGVVCTDHVLTPPTPLPNSASCMTCLFGDGGQVTAHVQPMSCDEAYFELPSAVDVEGVVAGLRRRIVDATGRGRVLVCAPPLLLRLGP